LITEIWWGKQSPVKKKKYVAGWNMNEKYDRIENRVELVNKP